MLAEHTMNTYSQLRVDFLGYVEDNWTIDFEKLKKLWLKNREKKKYAFDDNFTTYLNLVRHYGYCEWDPPQKVYNAAIELLARQVVYYIEPIP